MPLTTAWYCVVGHIDLVEELQNLAHMPVHCIHLAIVVVDNLVGWHCMRWCWVGRMGFERKLLE